MVHFLKVLFLAAFFFIPLVAAETTFFDQDDAFVMGNSPATPTTGQATGGGGCRYEWNCTNWGECLSSGKQTRNCTNIGTCSDGYKTPEIEQNCTHTAPKVEEESKELEKENVTEEEQEKETEEQDETGGFVDKNKIVVYAVIILIILSIVLYLKKDYFKKLVKKIK